MRKFSRQHENGFLFAQAILTIVGLFMTTYSYLISNMSTSSLLSIALYILLVIYSCWGFKVPHGDFLKYVGIILSCAIVYTGLMVVSPVETEVVMLEDFEFVDSILTYLFLLSAIFVAYISGRLDKHKTNSALLILVIIMLLVSLTYYQGVIAEVLDYYEVTSQTRLAVHVASYNPVMLVATFSIAYLTRYEPHIQAGIDQDAEESKNKQ